MRNFFEWGVCLTAVLFLSLTAWAGPNFDFIISTDYEKPLGEHIQWCLDHKITTEVFPHGLIIPDEPKRKKYVTDIQTHFEPNDLVPHQLMTLAIEDSHYTSINERDDIETFITEQEDAVIEWLQELTTELHAIYSSTKTPSFRFRLYNEVNSFELFEPEDYYFVLSWFYPLFKTYGPPGSYLMISMSGTESEIKGIDYKKYFRRMLVEHCAVAGCSEPLPFDGLDIHGYNTSYQHWSRHYRQIQAIFKAILPEPVADLQFEKMKFWALETARSHHGLSGVAWPSCIYEYSSDWDVSRHVIKTVSHVLNIPNMQFVALIQRKRTEWNVRHGDDLFSLMGLRDHGCYAWDKGTRTLIHGTDSIRNFTRRLWKFYPDTSTNHVFSITNIRRYQFRSRDDKYRLVVWRDFGNEDLESSTIFVPFEQYERVHVLDLITGHYETVLVNSSPSGAYIVTDLNSNPKMITPIIYTEDFTYRIVSPFVRSGVADIANFDSGTWKSILHLNNPDSGEQYVEVHAYRSDGTQAGSPFEVMIPAQGSLHLDLESVFNPFDGFIIVSASGMIIGDIEHHLDSAADTRGVMSHLIPIPEMESSPVAGRYLTTDWEIDSGVSNMLTLINTNDDFSDAAITVFDEAGGQLDNLTQILAAKSRLVEPIEEDSVGYRYGIVEVETEPGVAGLITRYSSGIPVPVWGEDPLQDDGKMVSELELKASMITDAQSYSRIIVSNPWSDEVTGMIQEKDAAGLLISETPVSLSGNETMELTLSSESVSTVVFKLDSEIKVFGRREDVITDATGQTITSVSSKPASPDLKLAGKLVLPYFVYQDALIAPRNTFIRVHNDNEYPTTITISLFDPAGDLLVEGDRTLAARMIDKFSVADLLPEGTDYADGSIQIQISQTGGITADADYIIQLPDQSAPMTMSAAFGQMY